MPEQGKTKKIYFNLTIPEFLITESLGSVYMSILLCTFVAS
jgi:hypothetical protein